MTPIASIKTAIRAALLADVTLTGMLGGAKVFDDVPRGVGAPYIAFAEAVSRENGTATDRGHLTELTLHVWSRQGGSREALAVAEVVEAVLDDGPLTVAGHHTVSLRVTATETRRQPDKDLTRVALRLRIVTEVI